MKYIKTGSLWSKSYSAEYSAIWNKEIPLEADRKKFMTADMSRRRAVFDVYASLYSGETIDSLSIPWGC
jgi:hypothetical protein